MAAVKTKPKPCTSRPRPGHDSCQARVARVVPELGDRLINAKQAEKMIKEDEKCNWGA